MKNDGALNQEHTCGGTPDDASEIPDCPQCVEMRRMSGLLLEALETFVANARETYNHWDADNDHKVGKRLAAMEGSLKGYRNDLDAVHALIAEAKSVLR
jgi:hypothetical protein